MSNKIMPVTDLRRQTRAVIRKVREDGDVIFITQHGRPAAVLLDYDQYERLLAQANLAAQTGWPPNYFAGTYGALQDDPLTRAEQGSYEERESEERSAPP